MEGALATIKALRLKPSFVIMTGGGYQPLWLLDHPLQATDEVVRRAEAIGKRIAELTSSDPVQNVDRILRLPFTRNYPNARKRAEGRTACNSDVLLTDVWS